MATRTHGFSHSSKTRLKTFTSSVKPLCAIILAAAFLQGCGGAENASIKQVKTQEYIDRAESYRRQGQYRAAIIEARNALQQNPNNRAAITELAAILNELGQGKPAAKLMEPLAADADKNEALTLAQAYSLQQKHQSVLDYLNANESRLHLGEDESANLIRARAELQHGNIDAAQRLLARMSNKNVAANLLLVQISLLHGDRADANSRIAQLLQQNPDNVDVLTEGARQAEQRGDLAEAEDLLGKALINLRETDILLPQKVEVLQRLVTTLTKLGRSNEALIYAKTLADANPEGKLLQDKFKQGLELFQAGKLDEAEPILTEVYNESHNDTVGTLLGIIRYNKKDLNGAANYLAANVDPEVSPDLALTTLAATQLQLSQPEKLLALFDAPARARIKNPVLKMLVGIALTQTGSPQEGEQLIATAQTEQPDNPAIAATLARYYLLNKQFDKAIASLQRALNVHRDDSLQRLLIIAFANSNKADQAIATARALAASNPPKAENWWILGRTALLLQRPDLAESALQTALKQRTDYLPAQLDMAQLQLLRKQPEYAETQYRQILKQHAENIAALQGLIAAVAMKSLAANIDNTVLAVADNNNARAALAEYHLRMQQPEIAAQLLGIIPNDTASSYALQLKQALASINSIKALQARDFDSARNYAVTGLKINPRNTALLILLARIELGAGKPDEARKIAAQLAPQSALPEVLELQGDLAALDKQDKSAVTFYRSAWTKKPGDSIAMKLYQRLQQTNNSDEAEHFLSEWQQQIPASDSAWMVRGLQEQKAGDMNGAIGAYEKAAARNPKNAEALNNLALLYQETKDKRALSTAAQAYALEPKHPAILDTYGLLLAQSGQHEKGLALLRDAAALVPESKEIQQHVQQVQALHGTQ